MWFIKLGSAIKGPFSEDQLAAMLTRGEFSKSHLVSSDRQKWEQAGFLVELLERRLGATTSGRTTNRIPSSDLESKNWYFAENGQKLGPFTNTEIRGFVRDKRIQKDTLVYGPETREWVAAGLALATNFPKTSSSRSLKTAVVAASFVSVIGLLSIAYFSGNSPEPPIPPGPGPGPVQPDVVAKKFGLLESPDNEDEIVQAIGRVQIIKKFELPNGSVVEDQVGHGSAFCVTPSGYFLTNRHVVEGFSKDRQEDELIKDVRLPRTMSILIFLNKLRFEAELVHTSNRFDLAVLKIARGKELPYFALCKSSTIRRNVDVVALGFPGVAGNADNVESAAIEARLVSEFKQAMSSRRVVPVETTLTNSAFTYSRKKGPIDMESENTKGKFIFHDAKIHGGNSGGPVVLADGRVLAINTEIKRDLDIKEVDLSNGTKGVIAINDGNLNIAYLVDQFKDELDEYVPGIVWK